LGSRATIQLFFWVKLFTLLLLSSSLNVFQTTAPLNFTPIPVSHEFLFLTGLAMITRSFLSLFALLLVAAEQ